MQREFTPINRNFPLIFAAALIAVLIAALVWRCMVLASGAVTFHSDEAIIGLMARHINLGRGLPIFFYGQPYMGSLDALLVAGSFRLFGESVLAIRLPQIVLFLAFVATTMLLAARIADRRAALLAGLLAAFGSPLLVLYSTMTLGGYGELLLLGNVALLAGWEIGRGRAALRWWALLGAAVGVGWWTHGLIVTYALGIAVWLLLQRQINVRGVIAAAGCFLLFSAPWWWYQLNNDWASLRFLLGGFAGGTVSNVSIPDKLLGLLLIGVPGLVGARYSWDSLLWSPLGWAVVILWAVMLVKPAPRASRHLAAEGKSYLWLAVLAFVVVFIFSSFGVDATGRYLLPLVAPLLILLALAAQGRISTALVLALIVFQTAGVIHALRHQPPGLTPQFDPQTDMPNADDGALIDFMLAHDLRYGYATYWISYRIAFLSGERIILAPLLPYDTALRRTGTDRYPPYTALVQQERDTVIVTANNPALDAALVLALDQAGTWTVHQIGIYRVYYGLPSGFTIPAFGLEGR